MFSWLNFLSYAVVTAVTPGPNNLTSMANAAKRGFKHALPFNFGIFSGFSVVMFICTFFCRTLLAFLPAVKTPMLFFGAAYMLFLAWKAFTDKGVERKSSTRGGFLEGFLLQFVNAKIYIYCIVSMEAYILPFYAESTVKLMLFALLLATMGFVSTVCWAAFGALLEKLFSKYARITNTVMALLLVYCAVSLFL